MTAREVLDGIKASSEGLTDLCAEHLRQSIRHVQRNCDIDCNTHEDEPTWDDCKQPDRYDGERMAVALAGIPRLIAAVEGVLAQADAAEEMANGYVVGADVIAALNMCARGIRAAIDNALKEDQ